jgi:hypothetical protein
MKRILTFFILALPTILHAQPTPVQVKPLYNYDFIGNTELKPGVNCFVITNRKQMEKFFGATTRPDTPNFNKEQVLVLVVPATKKDAKLSFDKVDTKAGNFMEVYYTAKLNLGKLTYTTHPVAVCAIPKYKGVQKVNFYNSDKRLIKSVEVK